MADSVPDTLAPRATIAVLASGSGSNLAAIIEAIADGRIPGRLALVVSDKPEAYALTRAREAGVPALAIERRGYRSRAAHDLAIAEAIDAAGAHWIALAGYMRLLSKGFVERYRDRIVNIHPSLLPSFPGVDGAGDALRHGVKVSGCTIHFVDEGLDSGPIIAQRVVPVFPSDDRASLAARILAEEHALFPEVLAWLCQGRVQRDERVVRVLEPAAIGVSACLMGEPCRWDGETKRHDGVVEGLRDSEPLLFCPEEEAGLGTPREASFLSGDRARFISRAGDDLTERFDEGVARIEARLLAAGIRDVVVKERSPSCGLRATSVMDAPAPGPGRFTTRMIELGLRVRSEEDFET